MEYVYAALMLNESGAEINENNLKSVLEAADLDVEESRVKALVAALEDVDINEAVEEATAVPAATTGGGAAPATGGEAGGEDATEEEDAAAEEEASEEEAGGDDEDEDEGDAGEGLGELFG